MKHFYRLMNTAGLGDAGGAGPSEAEKAAAAAAAANAQTGEFTGPAWAKDWEGIMEVEAELRNDPSLKVFNTPTAMLKSYVNAQKMIGRQGVHIPNENSTKEEHDQFWQKVGVPLEETKYKESFKVPEKEKNILGEEFTNNFLKVALENRLPPKAAQKAYDFFQSQVETENVKAQKAQETQVQSDLDALASKLGPEAYGVKLKKATDFLKENLGEETVKFLGESGLGRNAKLVEMFMGFADKFGKEGDIPAGDTTFGMTIAEIEREVNTVMGNFDDPYYKPNHPDNKRRVDEVLQMNRKLDAARNGRK